MIKYGFAALVVSLIWFFVRAYLNMPAGYALFQEGVFRFGDTLAVILGVGGIILFVIGVVQLFQD